MKINWEMVISVAVGLIIADVVSKLFVNKLVEKAVSSFDETEETFEETV